MAGANPLIRLTTINFWKLLRCYSQRMDERRDRLTALIIDAALHTCGTHGIKVAALSLEEHGVARETILRVLTRPRQRRGLGQWVVQPRPAELAELTPPVR